MKKKISGMLYFIVMYNGYDNLAEYYDDVELGDYGKDFYNYCNYISRNGDFEELGGKK